MSGCRRCRLVLVVEQLILTLAVIIAVASAIVMIVESLPLELEPGLFTMTSLS